MTLLARLFGRNDATAEQPQSRGDIEYEKAMQVSEDLIEKMRNASNSNDPVRQLMADLFLQRHNIPFVTTIHETVQEMKSPLEQKPTDR